MGAASYLSEPSDAQCRSPSPDKSGPDGLCRAVRGARETPGGGADLGASAGPEVRRGDALVAPERLGELRGLAVAHAVRDLPHGQRARREHVRRLLHPDAGEVVAERRVADLGVGALKLAP